jgi:hypothetical protein
VFYVPPNKLCIFVFFHCIFDLSLTIACDLQCYHIISLITDVGNRPSEVFHHRSASGGASQVKVNPQSTAMSTMNTLSANAKGKQKMVELHPVYAKAIAAATGSTVTALTSMLPLGSDLIASADLVLPT